MKIGNIISKLQNRMSMSAISRREAKINKYVDIHNSGVLSDSVYYQLNMAREIIANFARKNSVKVDIYNTRKVHPERSAVVPPYSQDSILGNLEVVVSNLRTGLAQRDFIPASTNEVYPKVKQVPIIIPIRESGLERPGYAKYSTEDNFLRNLYRSIEMLTKSVTGKTSK